MATHGKRLEIQDAPLDALMFFSFSFARDNKYVGMIVNGPQKDDRSRHKIMICWRIDTGIQTFQPLDDLRDDGHVIFDRWLGSDESITLHGSNGVRV